MISCKIRKDLIDQKLKPAIGGRYDYPNITNFTYRWKAIHLHCEQFQILMGGVWNDADSIDFEFKE